MLHSSYDDLTGFGSLGHNTSGSQEVTYNDATGVLSPFHAAGGPGHGGGGTSGGTAPKPVLVSTSGSNLSIDLVWDASVATAPSGFMAAVEAAANLLVTDFSPSHAVEIFIKVGWGEIAGQALARGALGESSTNGDLTDYSTVAGLFAGASAAPGTSNTLTSSTQFFLPTAEGHVLGYSAASATSATSPDGSIGFGTLSHTGYSWATGSTTGATQFNLEAVALHELTEVMGRISMEGLSTFGGLKTYTPLDLFDYSSAGTLALSNTGGYFSENNGTTSLAVLNNASKNGGDIADWASSSAVTDSGTFNISSLQDPFNAFARAGFGFAVSAADLEIMNALGYALTSTGQSDLSADLLLAP